MDMSMYTVGADHDDYDYTNLIVLEHDIGCKFSVTISDWPSLSNILRAATEHDHACNSERRRSAVPPTEQARYDPDRC